MHARASRWIQRARDGAGVAVRATIDELDASHGVDPAAVQTALRRWHTRALVRPQHELARLGGTTWYVYRDGHAGVRIEQDWWQADDVATARLGEGEVFMKDGKPVQSVFDSPRADGSRRVIEYRTILLPDERIDLCRWRELALIDAEGIER